MARSSVPGLVLDALAADPDRTEPYTTTEVRDWVAYHGHCPVTRDTIAHHLRMLTHGKVIFHRILPAPVEWAGKVPGGSRVGGGEHLWEMTPAGWDARRRAVAGTEG
jgi:hypothetical protein